MNPGIKSALIGLLVVVGAITFVVGSYLGYWWLRGDTTDRDVGITNRNTGVQTAWRDEALSDIAEMNRLPEDAPAREALRNQACDLVGRLTPNYKTDARIEAFENRWCE